MRTRAHDQLDGASAVSVARTSRQKRKLSAGSPDEPEQSSQQTVTSSQQHATSSASAHARSKDGNKKRVKKSSKSVTEQLSQGVEETAGRDVSMEGEDESAAVAPQHRSPKRVRFSDRGVDRTSASPVVEVVVETPAAPQTQPQPASQTPSGLTPHLRRTSLSPSATPHPAKASNGRRSSLPPATTHTVHASPNGLVEELQFSPLRTVLDERVRRRLRRSGLSEEVNVIEQHNREDARTRQELEQLRREIEERREREKQLTWELELQRQLAIDIADDEHEEHQKLKAMENELARLRSEIEDRTEQSGFGDTREQDDVDMIAGAEMSDDDDELVLINPADINVSQVDMTPQSSFDGHSTIRGSSVTTKLVTMGKRSLSEASTQVTLPDSTHEAEIHHFEQAVAALTREASDARAALQILSIELQSLGFTSLDAAPEAVLSSIRTAFREARVELEQLLPGEASNQYENRAFLQRLVENIRNLLSKIELNTKVIERHEEMEAILRSQNNGLLDKLSETDSRKQMLEVQWQELDVEGERKEKKIIELEEEVDSWKAEVELRDQMITEKDAQIANLENENSELGRSIDRLQTALTGYRDEVKSLEELVIRMEVDHTAAFASLEKAHADTVAELQGQLEIERSHRAAAATEADNKTTRITELELQIEASATDLDQLREMLSRAQEYGLTEKMQREAAEEELDAKTADIAALERKIEAAEASLEDLRNELQALRNLTESERRQREAAEMELDERNNQVLELESQLRDAGIRANELRQKLFEAQMQKEKAITELQDAAAQREEQFQNDMAAEIERRETAERTAAGRNVVIAELEEKLRLTEKTMQEMLDKKNAIVIDRDARILLLDMALKEAQAQHDQFVLEKAAQIQELHNDISTLTIALNDRAALIEQLQNEAIATAQAHQLATEQQDAQIASLSSDLKTARKNIKDLEAAKLSLEQRVSEEAEQMLALQSAHADAISALNSTIRDRDVQIVNLQTEAESNARQHADTVAAKEAELDALRIVADTRATHITDLSGQVLELKQRFRREVASGKATVEAMAAEMQAGLDRARDIGGKFEREGEKEVEEVEKLRNVHVTRAVNGKAEGKVHERVRVVKEGGKKGVKKRKWDSGFGVASDEVEAVMEA